MISIAPQYLAPQRYASRRNSTPRFFCQFTVAMHRRALLRITPQLNATFHLAICPRAAMLRYALPRAATQRLVSFVNLSLLRPAPRRTATRRQASLRNASFLLAIYHRTAPQLSALRRSALLRFASHRNVSFGNLSSPRLASHLDAAPRISTQR